LLDAGESFGGFCAGAWKIRLSNRPCNSDRTMLKKFLRTNEKISAQFLDEMSAHNNA